MQHANDAKKYFNDENIDYIEDNQLEYNNSETSTGDTTIKEQIGGVQQRESGQWAVYYTSPKSFTITFPYSLDYQLWGLQ